MPQSLTATPIADLFADAQADWELECERGRKGGPNVAFGPGSAVAGRAFCLGQALCALSGLLVTLARPLILRGLLRALPTIDGSPPAYSPISWAYGYAIGLAVCVWLENFTRGFGLFLAGELAPLRFVAATLQLIATKLMKLHVAEGRDGAETSLAGNDLLRLEGLLKITPTAGASFTSLLGGLITLLLTLGPVGLVGLAAMTLVIVITRRISRLGQSAQTMMMRAADERVAVLREILEGAKVTHDQHGAPIERCPPRPHSSMLPSPTRAARPPPTHRRWSSCRCGRRPISRGSRSRVLSSCATSVASASSR